MTQTPSRDWQKDMEMCEAATKGPWEVVNVGEISIAAGYRQDGDIHKATWIAEMDYDYLNETDEVQAASDATLMAEARTALPYWLQEAKTLQEIASGRGREALRLSKLLGDLNNELTASEERADAAEAALAEEKKVSAYHERDAHEGYQREQRLKVAIECAIEEYGLWNDKSRAAEVIITELKRELSTLYPDTPAPAAPTPGITARPIDEWHEDYGDALWWTFPIQEPPYCGSPLDVDWPDYHTHWTPLVLPAAPKEGSHETSEIKRCD